MSLNLSTSVTFYGQFTRAQLNEFMSQIPDHAKIRVTTYAGDMREPGTTTTFTATWTEAPTNSNKITLELNHYEAGQLEELLTIGDSRQIHLSPGDRYKIARRIRKLVKGV